MNNDSFYIQINNYDSYQLPCLALDHLSRQVIQVPIIRIYGSLVFYDQDNRKLSFPTLIHVHNVYPYCYISCDYEFFKKSRSSPEHHLSQFTSHLESCMAKLFAQRGASKKRNNDSGDIEDDNEEETDGSHYQEEINTKSGISKRKFIANILFCKAVPVYGYKVGYRLYYKINFLSPLYKSRFTTLFNDNQIDLSPFSHSKFRFEIFESHLPYISQFLTDYNLFSCNWVNFDSCFFRYPIINYNSRLSRQDYLILKLYLLPRISQNVLSMKYERISKSVLELDVKSCQILNRKHLLEKSTLVDFTRALNGGTTDSDKEVNLWSIDSIVKELDYQSKTNNLDFTFNPSVMENEVWYKARTEWNNQLELDNLLNYSIKLTNPIANLDISRYYDLFIHRFNDQLTQFPTSFKVTDVEVFLFHTNVPGSDLYNDSDPNEFFLLSDGSRNLNMSFTMSNGCINRDTQPTVTGFESDSEKVGEIDNEEDQDFGKQRDDDEDFAANQQDGVESKEKEEPWDELNSQIVDDSQILYQLTQGKHSNPTNGTNSDNPLSKESILQEFDQLGQVKINYKDPFYDNSNDLPARPLVFANKRIQVPVNSESTIASLPVNGDASVSDKIKCAISSNGQTLLAAGMINWEYVPKPPSKSEVIDSFVQVQEALRKKLKYKSQLEMPSSKSNDFKFSLHESMDRRPDNFVGLTNFIMELHVNTKNPKLLPNPAKDAISIIFYKFVDTNQMFTKSESFQKVGILLNLTSFGENITLKELNLLNSFMPNIHLQALENESAMINKLLKTIELFDPDILSGFEINSMSWGYLIERYKMKLNINLLPELSRCKIKNQGKFGDRWGYTHTTNYRIVGRYTLNIWRILRKDLALNNYSFENCCYHLYHQTFPKFLNFQLTQFLSQSFNYKLFALFHYVNKIGIEDYFINSQDLIGKNVEMSRLIGVDFNSNFYRGSQFKVESILSRLCKQENYILNSPSKFQVHLMKPLQQIPLIMEPESNFYKSPLVVLDFQSLYPSIVIAYNYCYSTLLCRLSEFEENKNPIGYLNHHHLPPMIIDFLHKNDGITVSPNGLVFINSKFRKSILAKMLQEILSVRINIKHFLKTFSYSQIPELYKVFDSRQLALKLIANVTYGYTSASFSGRMPNSDIADAIVATGREILTKSIDLIEQSKYGAKVVYGDTDSLFVYLPGKTRDEAFAIGESLSAFVSDKFPNPVQLKFEKVYHPCVLLSKKRYVGNMFESSDLEKSKFDAKGIETIRRDGIPAQQKMVEKALKILFSTSNLSSVKDYAIKEFTKISLNKIIVKDFCFAKEVRYGTYKNETYLPPGAIVARRKVEMDERSEPQYKERVPYVVYRDPTKVRLKDRCISPEEFIDSLNSEKPLVLDYEYYITKVLIPPLERIFNLMGADIKSWYAELLPKISKGLASANPAVFDTGGFVINFKSIKRESCSNCGSKINLSAARSDYQLCQACLSNPFEVILKYNLRVKFVESKLKDINRVCDNCVDNKGINNLGISMSCINDDCSNYFNKVKMLTELKFTKQRADRIISLLDNSS